MSAAGRSQKITFREMRESGVTAVLDLLFGLQMQPFGRMVADQWPDDVRLSDLEPRFTFLLRRTSCWFPGKFQKMFRRAGNSYPRSVPLARC